MKNWLKCGLFIILLGLAAHGVFHVLWLQDDGYSVRVFEDFYDLPENSVDAVFIGSSGAREYYSAVTGLVEEGTAMFPLAVSNMPFCAFKYMITEVEKTQDPSVYLIEIRDIPLSWVEDYNIRKVSDSMKYSRNRFAVIDKMLEHYAILHPDQQVNKWDYYFSYGTYHWRWEEIGRDDFGAEPVWQGFSIYTTTTPLEPFIGLPAAEPVAITEYNEILLNDLFDFCSGLDAEVLFVETPAHYTEEHRSNLAYTKNRILEAGFEILDMNSDEVLTELGFDYSRDFRALDHVNVYGALKVTDYLAAYVRERYGLPDRRMDEQFSEWTEDYVDMMNALLSQTQDEEYAENIRQRIGAYHLTYSQ